MAECRRAKIIVSGEVQSNRYRNFVRLTANDLNLKGYVKNIEDGTVEILAEGSKENLEKLVKKINIIKLPIRVDKMDVKYLEAFGQLRNFKIIPMTETDEVREGLDAVVSYIAAYSERMLNQMEKMQETMRGIEKSLKVLRK